MPEMIETEIDFSQTWGGLPAPQDWHIIEGSYEYSNPEHPRCGHKWGRLFGGKMTVIEDIRVIEGKRWLPQ